MAPTTRALAALAATAVCLAPACSSTSTSTTAPSGAKCVVAATSSPASFGAGGGPGSIAISTSRDCTWSIASDAGWIAIGGASSGQGEAVVPYTVAPNPAPSPRSAALTIGAERVSVSQAPAPCTYRLSSTGDAVPAAGGRLTVAVTTLSGCAWSASSAAQWLTIASGQTGTTNGTVALDVAPNSGAARTGSATIAGQTYTVTQSGADSSTPAPAPSPSPTPTPSPSPSPSPSPAPSPSGTVSVSGLVLLVAGKCPDIAFTVTLTRVTADKTTTFKHGKCGDLQIGVLVTVTGTLGSDGVVSADVVEFNE